MCDQEIIPQGTGCCFGFVMLCLALWLRHFTKECLADNDGLAIATYILAAALRPEFKLCSRHTTIMHRDGDIFLWKVCIFYLPTSNMIRRNSSLRLDQEKVLDHFLQVSFKSLWHTVHSIDIIRETFLGRWRNRTRDRC